MQRCELLDYGKVKRPLKLRRDRYPCSCRRPCNGPTPRRVPWVLILSLWACVSSFNVPYVISVGTSKGFFFWSIAAHSVWRDDLANRVTLTHPTVVFGVAQEIIPKTEFSLCSDKASQKSPKMDNSRWCWKLLQSGVRQDRWFFVNRIGYSVLRIILDVGLYSDEIMENLHTRGDH